ncbi:MAG: Homoserine/homoserine lactone efflux protein [Paracidovorax wautersii]|uniref:Homoserine/homoserine lactone efflux protein n=1 Tax=Paracidovorax wautersii TaxID=1177982 RepID=A0A7V8JPZ5_9BURK|nr:MAG: Homoserine/homoserine lactone efflux protein [Paracidovorax wautersii]
MELHTWLAYAAACVLIAVSPGSGAVLCMSHGLSYGFRASRATIAGLEIGLVLILLIAGAGVGSLLIASETAFWLVKLVGAGYLIYLGFSQWRSRQGLAGLEQADRSALRPSLRKRVATGFLTNATNPKGILFMVAVLPQFISPSQPLAAQLLILAATMVAIDSIVMAGYVYGASAFSRFMTGARAIRVQNRVFGGLLMGVGAGLLFVKKAP